MRVGDRKIKRKILLQPGTNFVNRLIRNIKEQTSSDCVEDNFL